MRTSGSALRSCGWPAPAAVVFRERQREHQSLPRWSVAWRHGRRWARMPFIACHHWARFCHGSVNATRTAKRLAPPATLTDIS